MAKRKSIDPMDNRAVWEGRGFARFKNKDNRNYRFILFGFTCKVDLIEWSNKLKKQLRHGNED